MIHRLLCVLRTCCDAAMGERVGVCVGVGVDSGSKQEIVDS